MSQALERLGITVPIIQAPMAGTSTPALAAAVSNAGGLGSIGVGAVDASEGKAMIAAVRAASDRPFNVNLFCNAPAVPDAARERAWLDRLASEFARFDADPPAELRAIYASFVENDAMFAMLLDQRPPVVSLHFGLSRPDRIAALRAAGILLLATATSVEEGRQIAAAGIDMIVAQGYEAGGHRGMFDPEAEDARLGTMALTRLLVRELDLPVIAAGGIMDGAGIVASLALGAVAAQMGTAFIGCPESLADGYFRAALFGPAARRTIMTRAISGRPARCLANRFTAFGADLPDAVIPDYPIAYDGGKALNAAAKAKGEGGYGAQWAGQGAPLARALPAAELMAVLVQEMAQIPSTAARPSAGSSVKKPSIPVAR